MENEENDLANKLPVTIQASTPEQFHDLPERVQQILTLVACGFSPASIAKLAGVSDAAIANLVSRYDPTHKFYLSAADKRQFMAGLLQSKMMEAVMHITPDKLESASAKDLALVLSLGARSQKDLGPAQGTGSRDPATLLKRLSQHQGDEKPPREAKGG